MAYYDTVIFDLDGTLLDTLQDLANSVNYALQHHGFPIRTQEEIRSFVGNGVRMLVTRALSGQNIDENLFEEVFADFKNYYAEHCHVCTQPYAYIIDMLHELTANGLQLAIVSNKGDEEVKKLAERYFSGLFSSAIGERKGIQRKPAPDSIYQTIKDLHTSVERTIFVGDSEVDVQTAQNAGVDCIAVTWGFRSALQLEIAGASTFVHSPQEIPDLLRLRRDV
jgi:phosphoglycolate phosphatase